MCRQSDGLSTRPDDPNSITHQSASMNYAPRDLLHGLLHGILPISRIRYIYVYAYSPGIPAAIAIAKSTPPREYTANFCIMHTTLAPSSVSEVKSWPLFTTCSDSLRLTVSELIRKFSTLFDSRFLTRFDSVFYSIHTIRVLFQSGFWEYYIGQGVFKITQNLNRGIFHNYDN